MFLYILVFLLKCLSEHPMCVSWCKFAFVSQHISFQYFYLFFYKIPTINFLIRSSQMQMPNLHYINFIFLNFSQLKGILNISPVLRVLYLVAYKQAPVQPYSLYQSYLIILVFLCLFPSVELQKANLEAQNSPSTGGSGPGPNPAAASPLASAIPLAQLLAKPGALNALSSLSALGGLTELLGAQAGAPPVQTTGVHRTHKSYAPRLRSPGGSGGPTEGSKLKERNKFNPY